MPENYSSGNAGVVGGSINNKVRAIFNNGNLSYNPQLSGDGTLRYYSTNDNDANINITVAGRNSNGAIIHELKILDNSGVIINGEIVFDRILAVYIDEHNYNINITDSSANNILTIESGITGVISPFIDVPSSKITELNYYSKIFLKNTSQTNDLIDARIIEAEDPSSKITFTIENEVNGSGSILNRLAAPDTGILGASTFSSASKILYDEIGVQDLNSDNSIGIWLKLNLPSGSVTSKTTYTLNISGYTI